MSRPYHLTIAEAGAKLRDGALSSVALTEAYLDRIATIDRELNCFITLMAEEAREAAEEADREIAAGCWEGPLHGVPIGLKDIY